MDDLEKTRTAMANRYRQLTRVGVDKDGEERGFGLSDSDPAVKAARKLLEALAGPKLDGSGGLEHQAVLDLQRTMRAHPLWKAWAAHQKGIGQKQLARLLAAIGDPYFNDLHQRPRTVSELWAYCGLHVVPASQDNRDTHHHSAGGGSTVHSTSQTFPDAQRLSAGGVAPKRRKGHRSNWSETARMRAWNIAGSCLKAKGEYAEVYYAARDKYEDATHAAPCVRCGPAGKPALAGSVLSDGHKHARALRIVAKTVLKDVWLVARDLHQGDSANTSD